MTDRLASVVVVFENDIREDDAQPIIEAIKHLRGVLDVRPEIVGADHVVAKAQARGEIAVLLQKVLDEYV